MRLVTDLVDLAELTLAVRQLPEQAEYILHRWLPIEVRDSIDYRYVRNDRARQRIAAYRSYDTPPPIGSRPAGSEVRGSLPPLSHMIPLLEEEQLRLNAARARGGRDAQAIDAIFDNDARTAKRAWDGRVELARGQLLSEGKVTIGTPEQQENGLALEADFDMPASHLITAGELFDDAGADLLGQLEEWCDLVEEDSGGVRPGAMLGSRRIRGAMLKHPQLRGLNATVGGTPASITGQQLDQIFESRELPPYVVNRARVRRLDDQVVPVIPSDRVILLPDPAGDELPGSVQSGRTLESDDLVRQRIVATEDAPGVIVLTFEEDLPKRFYTVAMGIVLPTLKAPETIMSVKVL